MPEDDDARDETSRDRNARGDQRDQEIAYELQSETAEHGFDLIAAGRCPPPGR